MDLNDLWNTLQATLLNDNDARRAAEKHLTEVRHKQRAAVAPNDVGRARF
jgi:hypothetical protein